MPVFATLASTAKNRYTTSYGFCQQNHPQNQGSSKRRRHCHAMPESRSKPSRIILTPQLALEIYSHKLLLQTPRDFGSCFEAARLLKGQSTHIGRKYNVSAKTIRDIWNRRTWTFATCSLWRGEVSKSAASASYSQVATHLCTQPKTSKLTKPVCNSCSMAVSSDNRPAATIFHLQLTPMIP